MNNISYNFVISAILLILYAVKVDADLKTLDASGTKCSTKLSLCELDPSKIASLGLKGEKGDKGATGPKGEPGTCGCRRDEPSMSDGDDEIVPGETDDYEFEWGTYENPGNTTCRYAPIDKSGTYYVYNSMEVHCDLNKKTTCVKIQASPSEGSFIDATPSDVTSDVRNSSWYSSIEFDDGVLSDVYNLTNTQVEWLQSRSDSASIKLRYHCFNTNPARMDAPVLLLSWTDAIIGPVSTPSSPIHYTYENEGCSKARDGFWSSTDIVIRNTSAYRLPITDFYIQDVSTEDQKHKISVLELCFY